MGSVFAVSTVLGPLLGGRFVQVTGWRWLFAFNIPLSLFANRNFRLVTITGLLVELGLMGTTSYMPTYLQIVHDLSPELAGLMTCPMMAGVLITSTATAGNNFFRQIGGTLGASLVGTLFTARLTADPSHTSETWKPEPHTSSATIVAAHRNRKDWV